MNGYIANIEKETISNSDYRRVMYTGKHTQLVFMSLKPAVEIGNEVHDVDQFIRVDAGRVRVSLNYGEIEQELGDGGAIFVPAGTWHNLTNIGDDDVKLSTLYSPPEHQLDTVQPTKADEVEDHFDGRTTE